MVCAAPFSVLSTVSFLKHSKFSLIKIGFPDVLEPYGITAVPTLWADLKPYKLWGPQTCLWLCQVWDKFPRVLSLGLSCHWGTRANVGMQLVAYVP